MSAARRRLPWWLVLVAFVVVPLVEIYVIIQVGQVIGAWWTIVLLIADSVLGSWLVKREGSRTFQALRVALQEGRMPHRELADGMLVLIGGVLMVSPGFVLDVLGILAILPFTRPLARRTLAGFVGRKLQTVGGTGFATYAAGSSSGPAGPAGHNDRPGPDVVRGDVVE